MTENNPYSSPESDSPDASSINANSSKKSKLKLVARLFLVMTAGIIVGSYISSELRFFHFPDEPRSVNSLVTGTIAGTLSSPIAMSFGILATLRFYGEHGWLVFPGIAIAITGWIWHYKTGDTTSLVLVFIGFCLWAHNNYLAFSALMSVQHFNELLRAFQDFANSVTQSVTYHCQLAEDE